MTNVLPISLLVNKQNLPTSKTHSDEMGTFLCKFNSPPITHLRHNNVQYDVINADLAVDLV